MVDAKRSDCSLMQLARWQGWLGHDRLVQVWLVGCRQMTSIAWEGTDVNRLPTLPLFAFFFALRTTRRRPLRNRHSPLAPPATNCFESWAHWYLGLMNNFSLRVAPPTTPPPHHGMARVRAVMCCECEQTHQTICHCVVAHVVVVPSSRPMSLRTIG